jgi:2-methylcitrate dehydratase PrpD
MGEKKVGRPSRKYDVKPKFFNLRVDLADRLETYQNQTKIANEALELYFNIDVQSNQHLIQLREEKERELKSINSILGERKEQQERQNAEKEQRKLEADYGRFCKRIENDLKSAEHGGFHPFIRKFNESFGIHVTEEQYWDILSSFKKGKFSLDDFKKLRVQMEEFV